MARSGWHDRPHAHARVLTIEAACARALYHATVQYRSVKNILVGGHDTLPLPSAGEPASPYASAARFARDAQSLFDTDEALPH